MHPLVERTLSEVVRTSSMVPLSVGKQPIAANGISVGVKGDQVSGSHAAGQGRTSPLLGAP